MRQRGRGTRAAVTQHARVKCVVIDKPSDARLRNQASVAEQDVRKRLMCHLPVFSLIITGSASKAEKGPNFIKQTFPKKGVGKFSKKLHFWNQQGVSFRVVCFVCFEPSDPFQRTVPAEPYFSGTATGWSAGATQYEWALSRSGVVSMDRLRSKQSMGQGLV